MEDGEENEGINIIARRDHRVSEKFLLAVVYRAFLEGLPENGIDLNGKTVEDWRKVKISLLEINSSFWLNEHHGNSREERKI
jgi:hypothetical protein